VRVFVGRLLPAVTGPGINFVFHLTSLSKAQNEGMWKETVNVKWNGRGRVDCATTVVDYAVFQQMVSLAG
jgi:hypothetical protein